MLEGWRQEKVSRSHPDSIRFVTFAHGGPLFHCDAKEHACTEHGNIEYLNLWLVLEDVSRAHSCPYELNLLARTFPFLTRRGNKEIYEKSNCIVNDFHCVDIGEIFITAKWWKSYMCILYVE